MDTKLAHKVIRQIITGAKLSFGTTFSNTGTRTSSEKFSKPGSGLEGRIRQAEKLFKHIEHEFSTILAATEKDVANRPMPSFS